MISQLLFVAVWIRTIRIPIQSRNSTGRRQNYDVQKSIYLFSINREMNILQEFHGRESDKIWPEVKKYLDRVLKEASPRKQG
jgi:hypothetical protein